MGKATDRKRAGDRSYLDAIADRVAITDLEGRILDVNQAMIDFQGRSREQIVGRLFVDLVAPADRQRIWGRFQETIERGFSDPFEYRTLLPSGKESYAEVKALVIRDGRGRPKEALAVIRDVTHRKEIEKRLAESEEMYRDLLDNIHEAVFKVDEGGIVRFVSSSIKTIIGYEPHELIGRSFAEFIFEEDLEYIQKQFQKLAENILEPDEYRIKCRNGDVRWIRSSSRPVFEGGAFRGINGVLADIHERKVAQLSLARQQELLQQAQKMEAIGTLAGGIAHDFNNLLMGIEGRVSLMLMSGEADPSQSVLLREIEALVRSASGLTRQLLGLASGGKYEVRPSDINELVRRTVGMFGRTHKEMTVDLRLEPGLWAAEVDRTQIEQVLLNLLVNARQAMPGGGPVVVETRNQELKEGDAGALRLPPGRYLRLGISDSGVGMDETTRSRIFDPFFTTKEMGRGTGLGLASAYGIVKNHGGIITVHSDKGKGSTFHVFLPATTRPVEKDREPGEDAPAGRETVLVIDDEEMVLDVARQMLESLGYRVFSAGNGNEALDIFARNRGAIHLVILDMVMPHMGGAKVFEALRAMDPRVRILLSSGYSLNGQATEIMSRGCQGFIQKPFSVQDLARKLRDVLDG